MDKNSVIKDLQFLSDIYNQFSPDRPLPANDPVYVDCSSVRGNDNIIRELGRKIVRSNKSTCQLYTGHRGGGKSTELLRLEYYLKTNGCRVVYFEADEDLELRDVGYPDINMSQEKWEIQKYITSTNICPFDEWFNQLDLQTQVRIDVRIDRISLGNFGDYKSVGQGVYELRLFFGAGYRIYYGIIERKIVLLLMGGSKKTQNRDIKTAKRFWSDYKNEQGGI